MHARAAAANPRCCGAPGTRPWESSGNPAEIDIAAGAPRPTHDRKPCKIKGWGPPAALEVAMPRAGGGPPTEILHHIGEIN